MFLKYYQIFIGRSGYNRVTVSKFTIRKNPLFMTKNDMVQVS